MLYAMCAIIGSWIVLGICAITSCVAAGKADRRMAHMACVGDSDSAKAA